jgi:hypothetical protein
MATMRDTPMIRRPSLLEQAQSEPQHLVRRSIKSLASVADSAIRAGRSILTNLPVRGRPSMFAGRSLPALAAHDVVCAMTELEHGLNPFGNPERPVPEPDAYEVFQAGGGDYGPRLLRRREGRSLRRRRPRAAGGHGTGTEVERCSIQAVDRRN